MKIEGNDQPWSKSPVEATPSLQETLTQRKMKEAPMGGAIGAGPQPYNGSSWGTDMGISGGGIGGGMMTGRGTLGDPDVMERIHNDFRQKYGRPAYTDGLGNEIPAQAPMGGGISTGKPVPSGQERPMIEGLGPVLAKLFDKTRY